FRALVKEARALSTDILRVYYARRESGFSWKMRALKHEEKWAALLDGWNRATRNNVETYRDSQGTHTTVYGPTAGQRAADAQNDATMVSAEMQQAKLNEYEEKLCIVEGMAFDELGGLWEQKMLPRLKAAVKEGPAQRLMASEDHWVSGTELGIPATGL